MLNKFCNKIVLTIIALCLVIITIYIINSGFFKKNSDWKLVSDSKNHVYIFRNEGKEVCSAYIRFRWHDLRRVACSRLFEKGFGVEQVQAISGHKDPTILLNTYTRVDPGKLVKKLG